MADKRTINLKVKLSAYTRGILPTKLSQLENDIDAPKDGRLYGRRDAQWVDIDDVLENNIVLVDEGSGLDRIEIDKSRIKLNVRKWEGHIKNLPSTIEKDKVYYAYEDMPDIIITGGTAYSDENEEYGYIFSGGNSKTAKFDITFKPMNAKGEF